MRAVTLRQLDRRDEATVIDAELGERTTALDAFIGGMVKLLPGGPDSAAGAAQLFERAVLLSERPNQLYRLSLLRALFLARQPDVEDLIVSVLAHWPDSPVALFWVGMSEQASRPEVARAHIEKAVSLNAGYVDAWMLLSQLRQRTGDVEGASAAYGRGLELGRDRGRTDLWRHHLVRGVSLLDEERFDEALGPLEQSASDNPGSSSAARCLGLALLAVGRSDEGLATLEKALDNAASDPFAHPGSGEELEALLREARASIAEEAPEGSRERRGL